MPEGIARPSGAGATSVGVVERGPLHGVSLLVSAPRRLQPLEEGRISWGEHGGFTVEPKAPKCKTMVEWSRGFLRVVREAPEPEREGLLDFLEWGKTIAEEFSFHHFTEFYEHLVRKDQRAGSSVSINEYDAVWRVYAKQYGVRLRRPKPHRWNKYLRDKDRSATTGGGKGQKGGNGKGGKGGKGGQGLGPLAVAAPSGEPWGSKEAPSARSAERIQGGGQGSTEGLGPEMAEQVVEDRLGGPVGELPGLGLGYTEDIGEVETASAFDEPGAVAGTHFPCSGADLGEVAGFPGRVAGPGHDRDHEASRECERRCYEEEVEQVGCQVPLLTRRAHCIAAAFRGWHDVEFLVRTAACGAGWPSEEIDLDEPY
ncbi:hypothetical protein CYMTET_23383 [Cymbomonas tetramitiformis]|uniref:Uncharacterized protein n=1 Tax=Cymbomonas tetramitiformis TaxID=36881 RepID=A0AAE0FY21_9CHLO|nr:hypothetical protein CYMTET_23383 [Cymbomonas tetramitiformis]